MSVIPSASLQGFSIRIGIHKKGIQGSDHRFSRPGPAGPGSDSPDGAGPDLILFQARTDLKDSGGATK